MPASPKVVGRRRARPVSLFPSRRVRDPCALRSRRSLAAGKLTLAEKLEIVSKHEYEHKTQAQLATLYGKSRCVMQPMHWSF